VAVIFVAVTLVIAVVAIVAVNVVTMVVTPLSPLSPLDIAFVGRGGSLFVTHHFHSCFIFVLKHGKFNIYSRAPIIRANDSVLQLLVGFLAK